MGIQQPDVTLRNRLQAETRVQQIAKINLITLMIVPRPITNQNVDAAKVAGTEDYVKNSKMQQRDHGDVEDDPSIVVATN